MNLHFIFTVREVSEINDGKRTFTMPMYLALEWEVDLVNIFSKLKNKSIDLIARIAYLQWQCSVAIRNLYTAI